MGSRHSDRHERNSRSSTVLAVAEQDASRLAGTPGSDDVVFDFDGRQIPDVMGLSMVLTAREVAHAADAVVWLKDAPPRTWALLEALGIDSLFALFPEPSTEPA